MKGALVLSLILLAGNNFASAQRVFPPGDALSPTEYAETMAGYCGKYLGITQEQKLKVFDAAFQKKNTEDSLVRNGVHMETAGLLILYNSLDEKMKDILTPGQYRHYEQLCDARIYHVQSSSQANNPNVK